MKSLETLISPFVKSQFPEFYQEEGPLFVLFTKEYFKFLESSGETFDKSRNLLNYKDIDLTVDEFLIHFKEKYLSGVSLDSYSSKRKLIKAAQDIFRSKGTDRSIDLLFRMAFGTGSKIYTPGDDVLKLSDGTWVVPRYLEITRSSKTANYIGKLITGSKSGATAFVEHLITRNVNGKLVDLIYISNIENDFATGDIITTDGIIEGSPKVIGSLTSLNITESGQNFTVGEIVDLVSTNGISGKARVSSISTETGLVTFSLISGGWGYSIDANTNVSSKVITISNVTNSNTSISNFDIHETLTQNLYNLSVNNSTGEYTVGDLITNPAGSSAAVVKVISTSSSNTANLIVNNISGNTFANTILYVTNRSYVSTNTEVVFNVGDIVRQRTGSSNTATGTISTVANSVTLSVNTGVAISANGLHVGTYVKQVNTNATGVIKLIPREDVFDYDNVSRIVLTSVSGTFNGTDKFNTYSDSGYTTYVSNATPISAVTGYIYEIIDITGSSRWSSSNTILSTVTPTTNTTILVASDVGGTYGTNTDVTATGTVVGSNSIAVGVNGVNNTFYATNNSIVFGTTSNTYANSAGISTGTGAAFDIGLIENTETVRISPDLLSANGEYGTPFASMLLSGANSGYGYLSSVYVFNGGTGYTNGNLVVFSGGNTGVGSYGAANATITTDASGTITIVNIAANTGSGDYVSTPSTSIVNSTGGSTGVGTGANVAPLFAYGLIKLAGGDGSSRIFDLLTYQTKTIGSIASLSNINPGENYNIRPFVHVHEPLIAALGKRDTILTINTITGGPTFSVGEVVKQLVGSDAISITANNASGNTNFEVGEFAVVYNGATPSGNGVVVSSTFDTESNSFIVILNSTAGTFSNTYTVVGQTTGFNVTINNWNNYTNITTAKGRVTDVVANTTIYLSRESIYTDFVVGEQVVGQTSGVTANVVSVQENTTNEVIGENAVISANVITSSGAISSLDVTNSGVGYVQDETVTVTSSDGQRVATAKVNLLKQGVGEGYYSSTRGFLDNNKCIHDGHYYQEYSYEVQSSVPFERYEEMLKQLLHVSGTRMFGRFVTSNVLNNNITVISNIETS